MKSRTDLRFKVREQYGNLASEVEEERVNPLGFKKPLSQESNSIELQRK